MMHAARMLAVAVLCCAPLCGFAVKSSIDDDLVLNVPYNDVFVAMKHIPGIMKFISTFDAEARPRHLQCLDLFSGGGAVARTFSGEGFMSRAVDVKVGGPKHDMLTQEGFTRGRCG
jgi:hypothetical protein